MAGKRPDQHHISPSEGRTTDYKFNPETSHGEGDDLTDLRQRDKQRLQASQQGDQPFMPDVPAPSAEANRAAKREQGQLKDEESETEGGDGEYPRA